MLAFKIVTPEGIAYEDNVEQVTIPTAAGEITVLPKHMPLVSPLRHGEMTIVKRDIEAISAGEGFHRVHFAVARGIVEVRPPIEGTSEVIVLADSADRAEDIDLAEAEAARKRAEEALERKDELTDVEFSRFQAILDRELVKLKVGSKYKARR